MDESEKLIKEQFESLPKNVQEVLSSTPWRETVGKIGFENNLAGDQILALETETLLILYGFESPEDYIANIVKSVEVTEEIALNIAGSVGEKIISVIEEKIEESGKTPQMVVINKPNDVFAGRKEVGEMGKQPTTDNRQLTATLNANQSATPHLSHETAVTFSPVEIEAPKKIINSQLTINKNGEVDTIIFNQSANAQRPITIPSSSNQTPNPAPSSLDKVSTIPRPVQQTENKIEYPGNKDPYREPIS